MYVILLIIVLRI